MSTTTITFYPGILLTGLGIYGIYGLYEWFSFSRHTGKRLTERSTLISEIMEDVESLKKELANVKRELATLKEQNEEELIES